MSNGVRYIARNDERGWHVWDRILRSIVAGGIRNFTRDEAIIRAEAFEQHANAAHIVRCVNSHDALIKALKDMLRAVNDCIEDGSLDADAVKKHDSTIQARAALALAKEA